MKKSALFLGLSLLSSAAFAENNYNMQLDADYLTVDSYNVIGVQGTYYFDQVTTANTAWAEAAFMGRNNNASLSYVDFDGDSYALTLGGDFFHNNFKFGLDVAYVDSDFGSSDTVFVGEVGYFFAKNWLVSVAGSDEEFSDSLTVSTKYVAPLKDGAFINVEAAYLNLDSDFTIAADYYFTAKTSVGANYSSEEGYNFGVRAEHFFTPAISARVEYISLDNDDAISVGLTGRF